MHLSLVIVAWNAKKYVWECLTSLLQATKDHVSSEIIVVDNDSSDGTPQLVSESFPLVKLIRNNNNLGFAKAMNIGIKEANGEFIYLINSDVVVPEDSLEKMLCYMQENQDIGLLAPKMRGPDGTVQRSTMRFPTVWSTFCQAVALDSLFSGSKVFGGFLMRDFGHDRTMDVDVLNGWFWMLRRSALDQVGLLDERFFIYGEDIDWCRRFHLAGWRVVFYHEASAVHYGGASSARAPIRFYIEMQRANLQYWEKHYGWLATWGFLLNSWLHHLIRVIGYGTLCILDRSRRDEAVFKVKRSLASLLWLSGLSSGTKVER